MPTIGTKIPEEANTEFVIKDLDTVDEIREAAAVRIVSHPRPLPKRMKGARNYIGAL